jgi:hypothetical protein
LRSRRVHQEIAPAELDLVLLNAGLGGSASKRQTSGGSIGAIIEPCIEGDPRVWGGFANRVDDGFEQCEASAWQANATSNDNTIVARRT